jgi:hypothetical protein
MSIRLHQFAGVVRYVWVNDASDAISPIFYSFGAAFEWKTDHLPYSAGYRVLFPQAD